MPAWCFRFLSFLVAVPSAIKVFNWTATMYKGSISLDTPMLYAFGFIGLFTIGGLTGLFLAALASTCMSPNVFRHRALPLHHGRRDGHGVTGRHLTSGGRRSPAGCIPKVAKISALIIFLGFNLTFFPQLSRFWWPPGCLRIRTIRPSLDAERAFHCRRLHPGAGYFLPLTYLIWSWKYGKLAGPNPWGATGLEWQTSRRLRRRISRKRRL